MHNIYKENRITFNFLQTVDMSSPPLTVSHPAAGVGWCWMHWKTPRKELSQNKGFHQGATERADDGLVHSRMGLVQITQGL